MKGGDKVLLYFVADDEHRLVRGDQTAYVDHPEALRMARITAEVTRRAQLVIAVPAEVTDRAEVPK